MQTKGRIHSFETLGTLDGPGIRFIVFMQGCPLRCLYCHNRDTWDPSEGRIYTVEQVMDELRKYKSYMDFSGGGITVSGGEPTMQPEFVAALLKKCKEEGYHTALDTNGYTDIDKAEELLNYTDLVLLDIKHAISEKHKEITGVENGKILNFAKYLSIKNIPVWIRYVLLPGYTDSYEDLKAASEIIKSIGCVQKVEVLPYHKLGKFKWDKLGAYYPLQNVREPSSDEIAHAYSVLSG